MTSLAGTLAGPGTAGRCGNPVVDADDPATPGPRAKQTSAATATVNVLVRGFFDIHTERSEVRPLCPLPVTRTSGPERSCPGPLLRRGAKCPLTLWDTDTPQTLAVRENGFQAGPAGRGRPRGGNRAAPPRRREEAGSRRAVPGQSGGCRILPAPSTRGEKAHAHDVRSLRQAGTGRLRRPRTDLRPEQPRLRGQSRRRGRGARRPRARSGGPSGRPIGPRPGRSPRQPSWRRADSRSTRSKRCSRSLSTSRASSRLLGYGWHVNLQKPMCNDLDERAIDARCGRGQRPHPPGHGELHLLRTVAEAKETVESGDIGEVQRLPHEDGGQRPRRLGRARQQLPMAVPADAARAGGSWSSTTAGTSSPPPSGSSARSRRCGPGWGTPRSCPPSRSTRPTTIVVGTRERDPRRVGHHAGARHVPPLRLLHQ